MCCVDRHGLRLRRPPRARRGTFTVVLPGRGSNDLPVKPASVPEQPGAHDDELTLDEDHFARMAVLDNDTSSPTRSRAGRPRRSWWPLTPSGTRQIEITADDGELQSDNAARDVAVHHDNLAPTAGDDSFTGAYGNTALAAGATPGAVTGNGTSAAPVRGPIDLSVAGTVSAEFAALENVVDAGANPATPAIALHADGPGAILHGHSGSRASRRTPRRPRRPRRS
jgi:hypothetical protein